MLRDDIHAELIAAMKSKDKEKTLVLRSLMSEIKNKKIELKKDLEDSDVQAVVKKMIKQRKDSIDSYREGGRPELAEAEKSQIAILEKYLPEEMGDDELEEIVSATIEELNAQGMQDMGKVMGVAMKKVAGSADGNRVKAAVEKRLKNN
jgi:hypothetical protein